MKALIKYKPGSGNVRVADVDMPVIGPDEVLIRPAYS